MKIDYKNIQTAPATPKAAAMIETFRAIGYSLETAIADIIDNSISAQAKNVYINRIWNGGESIITIKDDGYGMTDEEIIQAMRPGSQNPLSERSETDLGRFGLGLKTASFSQCRNLTVMSKKNGVVSWWTWSLDYVVENDKWNVVKWRPDGFEDRLDDVESGTIVIWTHLDRLISPSTKKENVSAKMKFSEALDKVKQHLAMTFHRFMEKGQICLWWGEHEIEPWNPFCPNELKNQHLSEETLYQNVKVKATILPQKYNFSSEQAYREAEGMYGFSAHQGFYIYRGKRLLLFGDWLGIVRKEEAYKLVRIQIDLPNSLDTDWQIDIKKSKAYPPSNSIDQLKSYTKKACSLGMEVYKHRGRILKQRAGHDFQPLWLEKKKDNKWHFVVNREHQIVETAKQMAQSDPNKAINTLLTFIEESIPSKSIYANESNGEETQKQPYLGVDISVMREMIEKIYRNKLSAGLTSEEAKKSLKRMEPFNEYESIIDELV